MTVPFRTLYILGLILVLGACAKEGSESSKRTLTQERRDSILAETPLPGAHVVGRAIEVADSAAARTERLDSRNHQ